MSVGLTAHGKLAGAARGDKGHKALCPLSRPQAEMSCGACRRLSDVCVDAAGGSDAQGAVGLNDVLDVRVLQCRCSLVWTALVFLIVPETKGLSLEVVGGV